MPEQDAKGRFVTGNIGGGRPKGARNKLGEAFLSALAADFEENGVEAIRKVRDEKPDAYLKVIASTLPRELHIGASDPLDDMTDEQLVELLGAVRALAAQAAFNSDRGKAKPASGQGKPH